MPGLSSTSVSLVPHTHNQTSVVHSIKAEINTTSGGALRLRYLLEGDLEQLAIPAVASPLRSDGLWRHTCFEAFIAMGSTAGYYEFNFSPSTQWAAYSFGRYREGMESLQCGASLPIEVRRTNERLELEARISSKVLSRLTINSMIRMALSAVIEETDGRLCYWALAHPPGSPDFHHPDSFVVHLQRPVTELPFTGSRVLS
ncbi:MAG: DOMON-like domain-containing protein [Pseudomonadota bacterium]|nr:DOMON-like domain-containing protein [Pseudomonadota bacterium]